MAQTNYTPIQLYYSTTASAAPTAGNLNSGELAINITDGKLFYKDNAGVVQTLATKATTSGSFASTTISTSETLSYGTANGVAYLNGSKVVTTGSALTYNGIGLGIGVASATQLLNLSGSGTSSIQLVSTDSGGKNLLMSVSGSLVNFNELNGNPIAFGIGNSEQARLTSKALMVGYTSDSGFSGSYNLGVAGSVGIGTSSPSGKVHASNSYSNSSNLSFVAEANIPGYNLRSSGGGRLSLVTGYIGGNLSSILSGTGTNNPSDELMRFDHTNLYTSFLAGNVGIGTSSPGAPLHIVGSQRLVGSANSINFWKDNTPTKASRINFGAVGTAPADSFSVSLYNGSAWTEYLILDTAGNLGLGVTPSAAVTNNKFFTINGSTSWSGYNSGSVYAYSLWGNAAAGISLNGGKASEFTWDSSSGAFVWRQTPSSTAGVALSGSVSVMTLDASGNLLVGTTTNGAGSRLNIAISNPSNGYVATISNSYSTGGRTGTYLLFDANALADWKIGIPGDVNAFAFYDVGAGAERARIDSSGNLLVGRIAQIASGRFCVQNTVGSNTIETIQGGAGGYNYYSNAANNGGSYYHASFTESGTQRGSIVSNGSLTLYNTTSDQRLKENIVDAPEFGNVIDSLQVRSFDWKNNQIHQRAGFIAQELVTVAPEAVHQPADSEEMMAVDYSKLVPMLVKEIQSVRKRLSALESK